MKIIDPYALQGTPLMMSEEMQDNASYFDVSQYSVLIVEDQLGYRELICEAIAELYAHVKIQVAKDGAEAWNLLDQQRERPSLIIVDLNLPKISGLELLKKIKTDQCLHVIPVIIFSTSQDENDILKCYQAQSNCFITKPRDIDTFFDVVQSMVTFWFNLVPLPNQVASNTLVSCNK
jgi:CheY-like chemotaxis protein